MRVARIQITPALLFELLKLPAGTELLDADLNGRNVELVLVAPGLKEVPFEEIHDPPLTTPLYVGRARAAFFSWGNRQDPEVVVGWPAAERG